MSLDAALFPHVGDALTRLSRDAEWEEIGDSVVDVVAECKDIVESWYSDMLIGTVLTWVVTPPSGWLLLDGSTYASTDYPELSALLPVHLISGANFTLPDVGAAFPYGVADEDDGSVVAGANVLNLTVSQMPAHDHAYVQPSLTIPVGPPPTTPVSGLGTPALTSSVGSGSDVDIRPKRFGLIFAVYAGRE